MNGRISLGHLVGLLVLGAIWGASFMLIKIAVVEVLPVTLVALRLLLATVVLVAVLYSRGLRLPLQLRLWRDFLVMAILGLVLPFVLITWGQRLIPSSLTAILNATIPLFSVLVAYFWLSEERLSSQRLLGISLGFIGVLAAVGVNNLSLASSGTQGQLAVLGAALCYAVSGIYGQRAFRGLPPLVPATGQLLVGTLISIPLALGFEGVPVTLPSWQTILALLILAIVCTSMAYILFYWIMEGIGATRTAMVTYLIAPFGLVYGALLLREQVASGAILGLALVIIGIVIANRREQPRKPSELRGAGTTG